MTILLPHKPSLRYGFERILPKDTLQCLDAAGLIVAQELRSDIDGYPIRKDKKQMLIEFDIHCLHEKLMPSREHAKRITLREFRNVFPENQYKLSARIIEELIGELYYHMLVRVTPLSVSRDKHVIENVLEQDDDDL